MNETIISGKAFGVAFARLEAWRSLISLASFGAREGAASWIVARFAAQPFRPLPVSARAALSLPRNCPRSDGRDEPRAGCRPAQNRSRSSCAHTRRRSYRTPHEASQVIEWFRSRPASRLEGRLAAQTHKVCPYAY